VQTSDIPHVLCLLGGKPIRVDQGRGVFFLSLPNHTTKEFNMTDDYKPYTMRQAKRTAAIRNRNMAKRYPLLAHAGLL